MWRSANLHISYTFIGCKFTKIAPHHECLMGFLENSSIRTLGCLWRAAPPLVNMSLGVTAQCNTVEAS